MSTPGIANYARVSAFSPLEDRNTAYAHIQKEIQALEAAIRALKGHHNSLSSISRLPAELLSRIFELLARGEDYISTAAAKRKPHWIGAAPLLHTFQIHSSGSILPENLFSGPGGAPQLRCLSLNGCNVHWTSKFLRFLTHLTVARLSAEYRLSVNELITNLGNMPQLESIHLSSAMASPGPSEPNSSSSPYTHLPAIARIHLTENLMNCLAFFTKFTYPNTTIVSINCLPSAYQPGNVTLVRDLITTINAKNVVPITSLYVDPLAFRGQDSQGIRRVFVDFYGVSFPPSSISWDSLALHHLKSLRVIKINILRSV